MILVEGVKSIPHNGTSRGCTLILHYYDNENVENVDTIHNHDIQSLYTSNEKRNIWSLWVLHNLIGKLYQFVRRC